MDWFTTYTADYTPAEAHVFETGTHQWRRFDSWPPKQATPRTLYFHAKGALNFNAPGDGKDAFDEYVSDPAKPVRGVREEVAPRKNRRHFADVVGKIHMFT